MGTLSNRRPPVECIDPNVSGTERSPTKFQATARHREAIKTTQPELTLSIAQLHLHSDPVYSGFEGINIPYNQFNIV